MGGSRFGRRIRRCVDGCSPPPFLYNHTVTKKFANSLAPVEAIASLHGGQIMLSAGDLVSVVMAGQWRHDGRIAEAHADGTYDVFVIDEKVTLTKKPCDEVKVATVSREQRMQMDVEEAHAELHAPHHASARSVRLNQSRLCCGAILLWATAMTALSVQLFMAAFSLMPIGGQHPGGMCEICVWQKYQGRVCTLWPEISPRCHEHFMPYIYKASFAGTLAVLAFVILGVGAREAWGALLGTATLGESKGMTFHESIYPFCDDVARFQRAWWCCCDAPSDRELQSYDVDESAVRRAYSKVTMERFNAQWGQRGMV